MFCWPALRSQLHTDILVQTLLLIHLPRDRGRPSRAGRIGGLRRGTPHLRRVPLDRLLTHACLLGAVSVIAGYVLIAEITISTLAGLGSLASSAYRGNSRTIAAVLFAIIAGCTLFYQFGLPNVVHAAVRWPLAVRVALCALMLAPLGFALGAFMPLGLGRVAALTEHKSEYIAWSWAINGFFSVIGSTLTTIFSMAYGFSNVLYFAFALYVAGALALAAMPRNAITIEP